MAVLCPTTVLAQQHYQTFSTRLEGYPLTVGGRAATLASNDEGPMTLTIPLAGERALQIDVTQEDVPLTREQLIRFAEGVSVTG